MKITLILYSTERVDITANVWVLLLICCLLPKAKSVLNYQIRNWWFSLVGEHSLIIRLVDQKILPLVKKESECYIFAAEGYLTTTLLI